MLTVFPATKIIVIPTTRASHFPRVKMTATSSLPSTPERAINLTISGLVMVKVGPVHICEGL